MDVDRPADIPAGYERDPGTGLLVPEGSRPIERELWAEEEAKVIRRAFSIATMRGLNVILGCNDDRCAEHPLVTLVEIPGGQALVCRHKQRVIYTGTPKPPRGARYR